MEHVIHDLDGKIAGIIEGGCSAVGVESTVIDLFHEPPLILRPGGITMEQLKPVIPDLQFHPMVIPQIQMSLSSQESHSQMLHVLNRFKNLMVQRYSRLTENPSSINIPTSIKEDSSTSAPPTPGMKYTHYSPDVPILLLQYQSPISETHRSYGITFILKHLFQVLENNSKTNPKTPSSFSIAICLTLSAFDAAKDESETTTNQNQTLATIPFSFENHTINSYDSQLLNDIHILSQKSSTNITLLSLGKDDDEVARNLFSALRECDEPSHGFCGIVIEGVTLKNRGVAVMNRVGKAASCTVLVPILEEGSII